VTTTDTTTELQSQTSSASPAKTDKNGRWLPGVSGNPKGRPKGRKNHLTTLKQELEIAIRENMSPKRVSQVVDAMFQAALEGNVGAGKLILDKVISNAKEAEDEKDSSGGLKIVIEHANLDVLQQNHNVIDGKSEEIKK
jgi:hypothetical protein